MRRRRPVLIAALIALSAIGCSDRERSNPLDPRNPHTGGAPASFVALAGDGSVSLEWMAATSGSIAGFRLERRVGAARDFTLLADLPASTDGYFDAGLANGVDHSYRLRYLLVDGTPGPSVQDVATPGPQRPWVVDFKAPAVALVTPDGRHVLQQVTGAPFVSPSAIAADPVTGHVFVCDPLAGELFDVSTPFTISPVGALQQPVAVAVNHSNGFVWVCDQTLNAVLCFNPASPAAPVVNVPNFATPVSVAVDPVDGSVWVCERTGDHVVHLSATGTALGAANVLEPSRVAVDSMTRRVWVTSYTRRRLTVFTAGGSPVDSVITLAGPVGIAIDARAGRIWVADTDGDRVIAYGRDLGERFRVALATPLALAVDLPTGEAWAALPTTGQIARISPTGQVIRLLGGFSQPYGVAVETFGSPATAAATAAATGRSRAASRR